MGSCLILSTKRAQTPYYIEELKLSIYTMEELCYYIYNYLDIIEDKFIDERLIDFIGNSMKLNGLADKIIRWINSGSDFGQIVFMIEQDISYLSSAELNDFAVRLDVRRSARESERLKRKADTLVNLKKYRSAIRIYEDLLENERVMRIDTETKGRILHNRGTAYARLFMFNEAAESYIHSYNILKDAGILKEIYFLQYLDKKTVGAPPCMDNVDEDVISEWKKEIETCMENAENYPEYKKIIDVSNQDSNRKSEFFYYMIRQWKNQYRNMVE